MGEPKKEFVPALGFSWLTPLYDPVMKILGEDVFRERLTELVADRAAKSRVLDLGCGTATGTMEIKEANPDLEVVGVDIDAEILRRAGVKCAQRGVAIDLVEASAMALPFEDNSFDCVVSNLVFHHLQPNQKRAALAEVRRVLGKGGQFLLADFGQPHGPVMRGTFFVVQIFDGFHPTGPHVRGILGGLLEEAGFENVEALERRRSLLGSQTLYRATHRG